MATTVNLRKLLHRKSWEMCTPSIGGSAVVNTAAGSFICSDKFNLVPNSPAYFVAGTSAIYRYDGDEDSWIQLPDSGIAGTFGAGANGEFRGMGAMGGVFIQTATAGTTTTITTNRTIVRSLAGRKIRVVGGAGIGYDGIILSNTIGANAVITVTTPSGVAFDNTTQFQVFSGSLWFFNPGTGAVGFSVYDVATNAWTAKSITNLPTTFGTDGQLLSTLGGVGAFATGTATAGGATTLTNAAKNWQVNMWTNYQIRITAGTGIGQIRTIASNTSTVITVSSAWTINPDATSVYTIEGNEDFFYLFGNNAVTLYKYVVSTNTWSTLTPTAPRAGAPTIGFGANWIATTEGWNSENPEALQGTSIYKQNGRYIASFRGGGSSTLDIYDIAANTWISGVIYGNQRETFTTGTSYTDDGSNIYIQNPTGRIFKFEPDSWSLKSFCGMPYPQGTATVGQKMFILPYTDGGTTINFIYTQINTGNALLRMMII